jgi:hypothetical protein
MGANASAIANEFKAAHSDELAPNGALRVCIGGGAGFIGSHIAKKLKEMVCESHLVSIVLRLIRVVMWFVPIGKIMNLWKLLNFAMNSIKLT